MAGVIRKDDIAKIEDLQNVASELLNVANAITKIVTEAAKVKPITGLSGLNKVSKEQSQSLANLAKQQKIIIDLENRVIAQIQKEANARNAEFNAVKKEQQAKQALINTDTKVINQIKAEQQAINTEAQARIKNAQLIAAEERAKQAKIRTDRLEQGSIKKSTGAFKNLITSLRNYLVMYVSISKLTQLVTNIFDLTKKLDSLDFSMRTVIKSQDEVAKTQIFLSDTAVNYGQDILTLTERYIKFRAASIQSNMSARETMKIFDSTAKAAAVLGLKTDEVNGVFLALEQMISKGKVTTEELRRQLGERLPGAFGIMAEALGVSISQLDKMLKAGNVISTEALPKFAVALEKAYGIEVVKKVNTLAAAQGRLRTTWVQFVQEIKASSYFIGVLNNFADSISYIRHALGQTTELERYSGMQNEMGESVREATEALDKFGDVGVNKFKDISEYQKLWLKTIKETNPLINDQFAIDLFEQYIKKRRALIEEEAGNKTSIFNYDEYKKTLSSAEEDFKLFTSVTDETLKSQMIENSAFYKEDSKTYKEYINSQIDLLKEKTRLAEGSYKTEQAIQDSIKLGGEEITKDQRIELDNRYQNYQNYVKASALLAQELSDFEKKDKTGKTKFEIQKEENEKDLAEYKAGLSLKLQTEEDALDELYRTRDESAVEQIRYDAALAETRVKNKQLEIDKEIELEEKLLEFVEKNSKDEASIFSDLAKLRAEKEKEATNAIINERKRGIALSKATAKEESDNAKAKSQGILSDAMAAADEEKLGLQELSIESIKARKGNAEEIEKIQHSLTMAFLRIDREKLENSIATGDLTEKDEAKTSEHIRKIKIQEKEEEISWSEYAGNKDVEERQKVLQATSDLINQGFEFSKSIYDAQLQRAEEQYNSEIKFAGNSVEKRIKAEKEYEKEQKKIRKKQAISDKLQAIFNIGINTASAIAEALPNVVLVALVAALGAAQLATVVATPIPKFAKGTDNAPGTFIAGDEGSEAIIKPSGETILTPDKPTLFSDNSFIGSTIIPHYETQKLLANYAMNQTYDIINMDETNRYLKNIDNKLGRPKKEKSYLSDGTIIIRRGNVTTRIRQKTM